MRMSDEKQPSGFASLNQTRHPRERGPGGPVLSLRDMEGQSMSQGREWAEELAELAAAHHGVATPEDRTAQRILTHEDVAAGRRAWTTRHLQKEFIPQFTIMRGGIRFEVPGHGLIEFGTEKT